MSHASALNVYCRTEADQNRLLTEIVGPVMEEALAGGRAESFFFDRFDARGPHVFVMLAAASEDDLAQLRESLAARLAPFLADLPIPGQPGEEELRERHEACRGKALSSLDRLPGLAEVNTFAFADHPASEYPFDIWSGLERQAEFRRAFSEQSLWSIGQLAASGGKKSMGPGLRFLATIDRQLRRLDLGAEAYWRFHAGTLLPATADQIAADPAAAAASLAPVVNAANQAVFDRVYAAVGREAAAEDPRALREVIHLSLKQLGIHLGYQIPMVTHAWRRSCGLPASPPAEAP